MKKAILLLLFAPSILILSFMGSAWGQTSWVKSPDNPVVANRADDIENLSNYKFLLDPSVVYDSTSHMFTMWFASLSEEIGARGCISVATSPDGENWYLYARNPLLRPGGVSEFDHAFIYAGEVIKV